jgi:hypothetical protein
MIRLTDIAAVIRSKNAGPFELTLDVFFVDASGWETARQSGAMSADAIATLYGVPSDEVLAVHWFAPALGWKAVLRRSVGSGTVGDRDGYGAQQHAPLLALTF